jgi:hypothetical protein
MTDNDDERARDIASLALKTMDEAAAAQPITITTPDTNTEQYPDYEVDDTQIAVNAIMENSPIMPVFESTYSKLHCGDLESLRCVILASCLMSSVSSRGLHPAVTGDKGRGKTTSIKAGIHLIPQESIVRGSLSPKVLLYMEKLVHGKVIFFIDDILLNEEIGAVLKRCMSNFQEGTYHHIVDKGEHKIHRLPPRCMVINTSVDAQGDDQLRDRQLLIGITGGDDSAYVDWEQSRRMTGEKELPVTPEVIICRRIMATILQKEFQVHHHRAIDFTYKSDRRLINQLYDLVEASAILHYKQRKHETVDGVIHVTTADDDLGVALKFSMFGLASKDTFGRLTRAEHKLDQMIQQEINPQLKEMPFTERQIADIYGKSLQAVRKLMYGWKGNYSNITGGLCEHTKWYQPEYDRMQMKHVIICKKHEIQNFDAVAFARWV